MELIRGLHNLRARHRPCAATIGNFDGVHLGHQAVLRLLREQAQALGVPATVIVFEPQPDEYFRPQPPARLSGLRDKVEAFADFGMARAVCLPFGARLAAMPAEEFVDRLLVNGLGVRHLVVGPDFRFGQGRRGDFALLEAVGRRAGFAVEALAPHLLDGERVSSTAVRTALAEGDLERAALLLGRPYSFSGRVVRGDARGRALGFPTANLCLRRAPALRGVFAVTVYGVAPRPLPAVANVGMRPTVDGRVPLLEVHLLDFNADLYGRHLRVRFERRLRAERKFASLEALKDQIAQDVAQARACLGVPPCEPALLEKRT